MRTLLVTAKAKHNTALHIGLQPLTFKACIATSSKG